MNDRELLLAGVNVQELLDRFLNNTKLVRMVIGKFMTDRTFDQLKDAVAQGDMKAAEFACHSLKGVCGNLSLTRLFAELQEQLRLFRVGEPEKAAAMMPQITEDFETAVSHLKLWLEQQQGV